MPHAPMPWVKLYTSKLDDVRFNRLPEDLKWRWTQLTMLAGKLDAGGALVLEGEPMTDDEIAWQLRLELERWENDSKALKDNGYLLRNGHGWQLTDYLDAQGPDGKHAEQREQWRERQERHRKKKSVTGDTPVSHVHQSQSQSQSLESEKSQSQSVITRELLTISGVSKSYFDRLTDPSSGLTKNDFLAELARNYARAGEGRGKVRNPPHITAMNLTKGDLAQAHWYTTQNWLEYIPHRVLQTARPDLFEGVSNQEEIVVTSGYANLWIPENKTVSKTVETTWGHVLKRLEELEPDGKDGKPNFETWMKDTRPIHTELGKWYIAARNTFALEWLIDHNFATRVQDLLKEFISEPIEIILTVAPEVV